MSNDPRAFFESEWFKARPEGVQQVFLEFPQGTVFTFDDGHDYYMVGVVGDKDTPREKCMIIVSRTNPAINYQDAINTKQYVDYQCLKKAIVHQ